MAIAKSPAATQNYNFAQLEQLWIQAGGSPEWAPTMAAVAYGAESGGNPNATNPSGATGLWQIEVPGSSGGYTAEQLKDPLTNAKRAVALLGDGSGISNWGSGTGDSIGTAVQANGNKPLTSQQAQQYATSPPTNATLDAAVTTSPTDASNPAPIQVGAQKFAAPQAGVDIKNFHGYDLSSFVGTNELGNAEAAIATFANPNAKDANGLSLQERVAQDYGYTAGWALKHPEVGAVLIWSAQYADPSTAAGRAQELSQLQKTQWYQSTNENQRAFEAAQSTDPAKANQALADAQDKVQATAFQIGVSLSPAQMNAIAKTYAALAYVPEGTLGAASGTSQEQLDQMVVNAVTTVQKTGALPGVDTTASFTPTAIAGGSPASDTGIAGQLFQGLQNAAQQYLMYNPDGTGLLKDADLQQYVASYLQDYAGSGSYGSSNLINGSVAAFTELMKQQAKQMYPSMAQSIDNGQTAQQYVAPIQSVIQQTLGGAANSAAINFTDPQWNWTIATPDPKTGIKTALTPDQVRAKLVTMPIYDQSSNAIMQAQQLSAGMKSSFGFGG